MKSRFNK